MASYDGTDLADSISGTPENDTLNGYAGNDTLSGDGGADRLAGGTGADRLNGGSGGDTLNGFGGNDTLFGEDGQDLLSGGTGNDQLSGGLNSDTYTFQAGDGQDTIIEVADYTFVFVEGFLGQLQDGDEITDPQPLANATQVDSHALGALTAGSLYSVYVDGDFDTTLKVVDQNGNVIAEDDGSHYYNENGIGRGYSSLSFTAAEGNTYDVLVGCADDMQGEYAVEVNSNIYNNDILSLGDGIALADIQMTRTGRYYYALDDLQITLAGTTDVINVTGQFNGSGIEEIHLADGTVLTAVDISALANQATDNADYIEGDDADNDFAALAGNDTLYGMGGNDRLDGGDDNDALTGAGGSDTLLGSNGADFLDAGNGQDFLAGGAGEDYLIGGLNSDTYTFQAGDGQDTIVEAPAHRSVIKYFFGQLQDGDEITDAQPLANATQVDNFALGALAPGSLYTVQLSGYFDTTLKVIDQHGNIVDYDDGYYYSSNYGSSYGGSTISFTAVEGSTYDVLVGGANDAQGSYSIDVFYQPDNNDIVGLGDGIALADLQLARAGDDSDDLQISFSGSTDTIYIGGQFSGTGIEAIHLADGTVLTLDDITRLVDLPSDGNNYIQGDDTDNDIAALAGDDTVYGIGGNDRLYGGLGDDSLYGGMGADKLVGGMGNDFLAGGLDNDTYSNVRTDVVSEFLRGGIDTVRSAITYSLVDTDGAGEYGGNIENLTLTGTAAIKGTGNSLANKLTGNSAANTLVGGGGNDTLTGGEGNDVLIGGKGSDVLTGGDGTDSFVFNAAINTGKSDTITDFILADDTIKLENTGEGLFTALTAAGTLVAEAFHKGAGMTAATELDDRIIYDTSTGSLYYDADGSGSAAGAIMFATVGTTTHAALTNADFVVI